MEHRVSRDVIKSLHKKSSRDETGLFLIEGRREIDQAMAHSVEIVQILEKANTPSKIMERISYCGEIVAVAKTPTKNLQDFIPPENPLIIVLDRLEKPGNIGAIIRTAEAAGAAAVIISDGAGDLWNPNLIRASLGAVFCLPVYNVTAIEAAEWLEQKSIPIVAATPDGAKNYFDIDFSGSIAVVIGSEAGGISEFWTEKATQSITIPMTGAVNSLNVSATAAVLIYEAVRSRAASASSS